jgi:hypothetical protein
MHSLLNVAEPQLDHPNAAVNAMIQTDKAVV